MWYRLSFDSIDDTFTAELFEQAFVEYRLAAYVAQPGLLLALVEQGKKSVEAHISRPSALTASTQSFDLFREFVSQPEPLAA